MDICSIIGRLVSGDKEADGTSTAPIRLIGSRRKLRWSVTEILFLTRIRLVWWSYTFESKKKLNCIRQTGFIVRWKIFMKLVPWWIFHLNKFKQKLGSLTVKETELISTIIYGMQGKARSTRKSTKLNTGGPVWNAGSNIETGPAVRYVHHLFSLKPRNS